LYLKKYIYKIAIFSYFKIAIFSTMTILVGERAPTGPPCGCPWFEVLFNLTLTHFYECNYWHTIHIIFLWIFLFFFWLLAILVDWIFFFGILTLINTITLIKGGWVRTQSLAPLGTPLALGRKVPTGSLSSVELFNNVITLVYFQPHNIVLQDFYARRK